MSVPIPSVGQNMDVGKVTDEVFSLYHRQGASAYFNETININTHSIQCAMLAEKEGFNKQAIIGAFLHDIGNIIGIERNLDMMVTGADFVGSQGHDIVGAAYLRELGFPDSVCDIVKGHVQAKRYLVHKQPDYYNKLSVASQKTLVHQGGPMSAEEAKEFENSAVFKELVKLRMWDDAAKDVNVVTDPLDKYRDMCVQMLEEAKHNKNA